MSGTRVLRSQTVQFGTKESSNANFFGVRTFRLTPYEALRTAMVNAALYLDAEEKLGKVAPGFLADLILLAANPREDIRNTRTRVGVMKRGRWYSARELEAELKRLAEARK